MSEWARWLLLGFISAGFGVLVLANAVAVSVGMTVITGSLLVIAGVTQIIVAVNDKGLGSKAISVSLGVLVTILGVSFVRNPIEGTMSITAVVVLLVGSAGVLRLVWAYRMRRTGYYWMMLLTAVLSILLAGFIVANFEHASVRLLGILLGIELLFNGLALAVFALFLRTHDEGM